MATSGGGGGGGFPPSPSQSRVFSRPAGPSSRSSSPSSESIDSDFFDDDNSEDLSYSNLDVFPGNKNSLITVHVQGDHALEKILEILEFQTGP